MPGFPGYERYDGLGLGELVRKKEVEPSELVEEAISRIERVNPQINAVITKLYGRARSQARGKLPQGLFAGVPFLLKDLASSLGGEPHSSGTRFYKNWRPTGNSALVDRFLATGVIVLGKSNTPEFGLIPSTEPEAFGPTRNPWNPERTAGGSSGGTGAAVAARLVPLGSGGDGGGSIRIPASCNGVFGLKPTRGRTPTGPFDAEAWHGMATEHVLSLSVRDSAAMLDAASGYFTGDADFLPKPATSFLDECKKPVGKLRIALAAEPMLPGKLHADCKAALEDAAKLLKDLGHEVIEANPKLDGLAFARGFVTMVTAHTWANIRIAEASMGKKAGRKDFELQTWVSGLLGSKFSAGEYVMAVRAVQDEARKVSEFAARYDVVLNPTVSRPPPKLGFLKPKGAQAFLEKLASILPIAGLFKSPAALDMAAAETFSFIPYTPVYNATGQPSMSVPLHWNQEGLPIGAMFTAQMGEDALLLRLATQLEEARPWRDKKPPVS